MKIPQLATDKELFDFLVKNEKSLIESKCAFPIKSSNADYPYTVVSKEGIKAFGTKDVFSKTELIDIDEDVLKVSVIGNASNFADKDLDVLQPNCWGKSIKEVGPKGKNRIKHLKNHQQNTDGIIGYPTDIYSLMVNIKDLGYDAFGQTQCLAMDSDIQKELDKKSFKLYKDRQVNQHSIGLQYVKMYLCINDSSAEYRQQYENWNKYYPTIINKEVVNASGYFWAVTEIKLLEISAVIWGANEYTPTVESEEGTKSGTLETEGKVETTQEQPEEISFVAKEKVEEKTNKNALVEFYQNLK